MVSKTALSLLLISLFIIPFYTARSGMGKKESGMSPTDKKMPPLIGWMAGPAIPAQKIQQVQRDDLDSIDSKASIIIIDPKIRAFITEVSNTKLVSALAPFSDFGEAGVLLIQAVNRCVYHENYNLAMDDYLYPVVKNYQILINTAYPDVVLRKDGYQFAYRFLEDYLIDLIKGINALKAKKSHFMQDKVFANYLSNIFFAADTLQKSISAFVKDGDIRYEVTKVLFEFKTNPELTIEKARRFVVSMVQSMTLIDDLVESRYRFAMPLDRMTIFGDMMVVLSSLFDIVLKSHNGELAQIMHSIVYHFMSFQNDSASYIVSEFSKTGIFTIPLENRNNLINEILNLNRLTTQRCVDKKFEIYCAVIASHTSRLFDTLSNYLVEATDGAAKNYILSIEPPKASLNDQAISDKTKQMLTRIQEDLVDISSPLFKNKSSFLSVYLKTMTNASMKIIENYEQAESFLIFFGKVYSSITRMLSSSVKQKRLNSKGETKSYYLYDPKKCAEVKNNLENFGIFFGYEVLLNHTDGLATSNFYRTLISILEAWRSFKGDIEQGPEICAEPLGDTDFDIEADLSTSSPNFNRSRQSAGDKRALPAADHPKLINDMMNSTINSQDTIQREKPLVPLINESDSSKINGQVEVNVLQPVKRRRRRVIVFIEHLNCEKCAEDRTLMDFMKKKDSAVCLLL